MCLVAAGSEPGGGYCPCEPPPDHNTRATIIVQSS